MPTDHVIVQFDAVGGESAQETFDDAVIFARSTIAPPQGFNQPKRYNNSTDVATDLGDGSDAHVASQMLDSHGADHWYVVVMEQTRQTETLAGSTTSSISSGTVSTTPMAGHYLPDVVVEGTAMTVTAVTASPPDADGAPAAGEAYVNLDTGEVVTGTASTGGTGSTGIEVTYDSLSWTQAFSNTNGESMDIALLANVHVTPRYIGDLDELVTWGSGDDIMVPFAAPNGANYTSDQAAMEASQDVAAYVTSGFAAGFAHKSSDDVAADVAGMMITMQPWSNIMNKTDLRGNYSQFYDENLIGDPATIGTFEGGKSEAGSEGAGPLNVIRKLAGSTVISNDLTTAGETSKFQKVRAGRIRKFTVTKVKEAMNTLIIDNEIAFDTGARQQIEDALVGQLTPYDFSGGPYQDITFNVPEYTEVPDTYKNADKYGPIGIEYWQSRLAEQFEVNILANTA